MAVKEITEKYYRRVKSERNLFKSWQIVRSAGIISKSKEIKEETILFEENLFRNIKSISTRLSQNTFRFQDSIGVTIPRKGKKDRPIVIAPTETKIIQRSILDILQMEPAINKYANTINSYGGVKDRKTKRNVSAAINQLVSYLDSGFSWIAKSDIKNFFTSIPKRKFIDQLKEIIVDERFINLVDNAIKVELSNMDELGKNAELFPIYELGVAQGCCLSPFIGNMLLYDFDLEFNKRGIYCLRYIDDFLIVGKSKSAVEKALSNANLFLKNLGLEAYTLYDKNTKAKIIHSKNKFEFLGAEIEENIVRPSESAKERLFNKIDSVISESISMYKNPYSCYLKRTTYHRTLNKVDNILQGWIKQYSFCNDYNFLKKLNKQIDRRIEKYNKVTGYYLAQNKANPSARRQIIGVRYLEEVDWKKE